jgi:transposase
MKEFITIGVDLAKNYFQVHALEHEDGRATRRKLGRQAMRKFFLETKPCLVGMEACGSAHYWAGELRAMGHEVRLICRFTSGPMSSAARTTPLKQPQSARPCRRIARLADRASRAQTSETGHSRARPCAAKLVRHPADAGLDFFRHYWQ